MKKILTLTDIVGLNLELNSGLISITKSMEIINHVAFFKYYIEGYATMDDSEISMEEMSEYVIDYLAWDSKEYDSDMDKGMSKPNPPNYMFANNH